MERSDLLKDTEIFVGQGKSISENAADDCRIVVVGNPCNTNCMIAASQSNRFSPERFTAMTRLDQNSSFNVGKSRRGYHKNFTWPFQSQSYYVSRLFERGNLR